jgi:GH24 family phage-related lysozyme (muramidase)
MTSNNEWLSHAKAIVCSFQDCSLKAYPDPGTGGEPWTIGWGHTGPAVQKNSRISQAMADGYLIIDLKKAAFSLFSLLPAAAEYTPQQQAALVSFIYNVGPGAFADSTLLRRLLEGDESLTVVSEELPRWNRGGAKILPGLTKRRKAEVELFKKGSKPGPVRTAIAQAIANHASGAVDGPNSQDAEQKKEEAPSAPKPVGPTWPAGMVGPNDINENISAFTHDGKKLWDVPCLCRGQGKEAEWSRTGEDTPPGLYLVGKVYRDYEEDPSKSFSENRRAYGWYSFDLIGQEGQEGPNSKPYRDGIMIHGGGSACGWPAAWEPRQQLYATLGCIRMHNQDLKERLLPLLGLGRIWVSVLQEAK